MRAWMQTLARYVPVEKAIEMPSFFDPWRSEDSYKRGDKRICPLDGNLYNCIAAEGVAVQPNPTWQPSVAPSLWARIDDPAEEWPPWRQPVSAETAYAIGAKVSYNGKRYVSKIPANTTEPGTDARWWQEVTT